MHDSLITRCDDKFILHSITWIHILTVTYILMETDTINRFIFLYKNLAIFMYFLQNL